MRERCLKTITELAREDERVVFVGSDLGVGAMADFKAAFPDRFFMEGVSEQNLVGLAAGMAMEGRIVYLNTIATFLTRRCFEQVAVDLCMHNANVRLIANGGGVVYAPLGPTHLATEDIAILRALPNMTILAPADAEEMARAVRATLDHAGPGLCTRREGARSRSNGRHGRVPHRPRGSDARWARRACRHNRRRTSSLSRRGRSSHRRGNRRNSTAHADDQAARYRGARGGSRSACP